MIISLFFDQFLVYALYFFCPPSFVFRFISKINSFSKMMLFCSMCPHYLISIFANFSTYTFNPGIFVIIFRCVFIFLAINFVNHITFIVALSVFLNTTLSHISLAYHATLSCFHFSNLIRSTCAVGLNY